MKLKKILALAVSLAMVLAMVPAFSLTASAANVGSQLTLGGITYNVLSENLVLNGTFEENTDGWISWTGSHDTLGKFSRSTNQAHSGSYSLKSDVNGGGSSDGSLVGQFDLNADAKAGDKYILSFWFYSNNDGLTLTMGLGSDKSTAQVDIACGGLGNSGSDPISCNVSGKPTNQWHQIAYVLTAKVDSTYAEIYARWLGTDSYFDDVELYKVEQVSTEKVKGDEIVIDGAKYTVTSEGNLIENGSFEDASGNFDTTGWLSQSKNTDIPNPTTASDDHWVAGSVYSYYYMNAESSLGAKYTRWGVEYTGPRVGNPTDGNWYLMSQWSDPFEGLCSIKRSFGLTAGKKYVLQYDIKSNSGNKTASTVYVGTTLAAGSGTAAGDITEDWKTVSYIVDATDEVNTLWFNAYSLGNGICFDNFRLYEIEVPSTSVEVTATYTLNDTVFATEKRVYDSVDSPDGAVFPAKFYAADGSNEFYYTAGATLKADGEIPMPLVENPGTYKIDDIVVNNGNKYKVKSANLIPNGDFSYGLNGWFNANLVTATSDKFTVNGDGTVTMTGESGSSDPTKRLYRTWAIDDGKTYLFTMYVDKANTYHKVSLATSAGASDGGTFVFNGTSNAGVNDAVFTNSGNNLLKVLFRWNNTDTVGNFGLYELEFVAAGKETVINYINGEGQTVKTVKEILFDGETLEVPATVPGQEVYLAPKTGFTESDDRGKTIVYLAPGAYYDLAAATANAGETIEATATASVTKLGVLRDTSVKQGDTSFYGVDNNNVIRVASAGDGYGYKTDANGEAVYKTTDKAPSTLADARDGIVEFPVVSLAEGQTATMVLYVNSPGWPSPADYTIHSHGYSNGTTELRYMATVLDSNNWVEAKEWVNDGSFNIETTLAGTDVIFSPFITKDATEITFDVTDAMTVAANAGRETISFRLLAQYGAYTTIDREKTVPDATANSAYATADQENKAAYIQISDGAYTVSATGAATLTVNGTAVSGNKIAVPKSEKNADVRLIAPGAIVVKTDTGYYKPNENLNLTAATDFINTAPKALGLAMVDGAQVRIGNTSLAEDGMLNALADSGLRFLAGMNKTDAVFEDEVNVEYGIKLTAEGAADPKYVKAEKFQSADVFSAAVTNLKESNYNRPYTATAYAKVTMADGTTEEFNSTNSVTRSIYQVSAGIMKNGSADADNAKYTVDGVVKNILNAYINQTGIRLKYTSSGRVAVEDNKYTGDVFFDVTYTTNEDGSVNVTITPDSTWGTPVEIATWWKNYVRINNNNAIVQGYITNENISPEGVLTFTFTPPADAQ